MRESEGVVRDHLVVETNVEKSRSSYLHLREIGHNLYAWSYAHTVRIDKDDNIWAVDKGSDMIIRFNPAGRVTLVFGRKKEASDEAEPWTRVNPPRPAIDGQFRQVTDMTWDSKGNTYVSDGYVNSRIAKYDKDGNWVMSFGEPGAGADGAPAIGVVGAEMPRARAAHRLDDEPRR